MQLDDVPRLRDYLVQRLRPLTDADPDALADYTIALLRHDKGGADEMQAFCSRQLREFMRADADADAFAAGLVRYVAGGGAERGFARSDYRAGRYAPRADAPRPPYERASYERPGAERASYERPGAERAPYERQPSYDRQPAYDRPSFERQPSYERPPYDRQPGYERPAYDRHAPHDRVHARSDDRLGPRMPGRTYGPRAMNRSVSPPRGPPRPDSRYEGRADSRHDGRTDSRFERRADDRFGSRHDRQAGRPEGRHERQDVRVPRRPETPENPAVVHIDGLSEAQCTVSAVAAALERFGALRSVALRGTRADVEFARVEDAREAVSTGASAFGAEGVTLWSGDLRASLDAQERAAAPEISERQREAIRNMAALQQKKQEMLARNLEARADLAARLAAMDMGDPARDEIASSLARTDELIRSLGGVPPGESAHRPGRTENLSLDLRPTTIAVHPVPPAMTDPATARTALEAHGTVRDMSTTAEGVLVATFARHDDAERAIARLREQSISADWAPRDAPSTN